MTFEFNTSTRIIFGSGSIASLVQIMRGMGTRILMVSSPEWVNTEPLMTDFSTAGLEVSTFEVNSEPSLNVIREGLAVANRFHVEAVVAVGGGSVLDTGKALACLLTNPGDLLDFLEVVGKSQPLRIPGLPMVAVPTTAGTGSEVTRNAVLNVTEQKMKVSLRSPYLLPSVALVDPQLTISLPPSITAFTGMDALTQVLEPFVSLKANPLVDGFCLEGMRHAGLSLLDAYQNGMNLPAREGMSLVSLMGGLALANAGLGAVHGFAAPLGGMFNAPHGAICARLLPVVVKMNVRALEKHNPESTVLKRYDQAASILLGRSVATRHDLSIWIDELARELKIPGLKQWGVNEEYLPEVARKAAIASSMQANPIRLTEEEMVEILSSAL